MIVVQTSAVTSGQWRCVITNNHTVVAFLAGSMHASSLLVVVLAARSADKNDVLCRDSGTSTVKVE